MEHFGLIFQNGFDRLTAVLMSQPLVGIWYTALVRILFPVIAVLILYRAVRSLLRIPHTPEVWGQLSLPNGTQILLTHWENIIGRGRSADVYLNYPSISRQHAALCRGEDDQWTVYDLGSKGGTLVNGEAVEDSAPEEVSADDAGVHDDRQEELDEAEEPRRRNTASKGRYSQVSLDDIFGEKK